jgi:DNA polymerase-1
VKSEKYKMAQKTKTTKTKKKKLVLFDAHAILHRAYHALPDFVSSKGEPTGGLYGLSTMLIRIIGELKPDYMAACYDRPEATFRKEAFDGYKAQRKKADEELIAQMIRSRDIFGAFDIPVYEKAGFEADDLIGTLVEQAKKNPALDIIIASGDMDTLQLIDDKKVEVYTLKRGLSETITYDEVGVRERFGFGPELLPDYKGLRGDPSDNIPGVAGIGEKTATDLIVNFGSIEEIYKSLKKDEAAFEKAGIKKRIVELLKENEEEAVFSKMLATIRCDVPVTFDLPQTVWTDHCDIGKIETLFTQLDFRSLLPRTRALLPEVLGKPGQTEETEVREYDPAQVKRVGVALWLIDSAKTTPTVQDILEYAKTNDLDEAEKKIMGELRELKLDRVYDEIEAPLMPIITRAEKYGILIDKKYLATLGEEYHGKLDDLEKRIFQEVGEEFNLNSPKQLGRILFDELKISLKGLRKTAGGARSTKESELEKIRNEHAIVPLILEHREYQKLLSTYIDNIPKMTDENGRLHTNLNQAGTTTGRMSSNNPNLQNIPVREGNGSRIRNAFIAASGHKLLAFDYSQIEMRVLADLADETELLKVFEEGKDVHASVASRVFGVPENEVTKDMRRKAKVINFGIIYGMGVNALKANLGSTREEAQKFYDHFFATFPKIREYFDNVISGAYKKGYTETRFGRRRYFPELGSQLPYLRAGAERMAMNAPLQGTAADLVKIAIVRADQELERKKLDTKAHLLLQIHDELMYEIENESVDEAAKVIEEAMEKAGEMRVPLRVNWGAGKSWGEIEK